MLRGLLDCSNKTRHVPDWEQCSRDESGESRKYQESSRRRARATAPPPSVSHLSRTRIGKLGHHPMTMRWFLVYCLPLVASWHMTRRQSLITVLTTSIDVGGGSDLRLMGKKITPLILPIDMEGSWKVTRTVMDIQGDKYQAESVYKALGGSASFKVGSTETYRMRAKKGSDGGPLIWDWPTELESRLQKPVVYDLLSQPNVISYDSTKISIVQRTFPNKGIGSNDLVYIQQPPFERAALIKTRYRSTDSGYYQGIEQVQTFRVLDGVAGTELPTSISKYALELVRE